MAIFNECLNDASATSIEEDAKILALEAAIGTAGGLLEIFSRIIPKTVALLSELTAPIVTFTASKETKSEFSGKRKQLIKRLDRLPFNAYKEILVQVPEGFQGNLVKYVTWLHRVQVETIRGATELMADYGLELSMFLSNTDYRKSLKSHEQFFKKVRSSRLVITEELESFFNKNKVLSRVPLGHVVGRFAEVDDLLKEADALESAKDLRSSLRSMMAGVTHATDLLALLKDKLEKNELEGVSGDMAKHIAEGAFECGKYVELVSILVYHGDSVLASVESISNQLDDVTK